MSVHTRQIKGSAGELPPSCLGKQMTYREMLKRMNDCLKRKNVPLIRFDRPFSFKKKA